MEPLDEADFDKWYREEHIPLFSKVAGFHRSTRYRWQSKKTFNGKEPPAPCLTIHEIDDASCLATEEAKRANSTEWTAKHVKESKKTEARAWRLLHSVHS